VAAAVPLTGFQSAVLDWSHAGGGWRDLPWRHTRDPWAVLVSEVMLQQTQAARVVPRWRAFLDRFPTPAACAAAPPGAVIDLWVGLGYNRRAVLLHRAAVEVVDRFGGRFPADLAALRSLPGVGPYTARAVLAFAFEADAAVVDTNVARVLARAVAGRPLRPAEVQAVADATLPPGHGWRWNQAMLDLGAGHCTARRPGCAACPLAAEGFCEWARTGFSSPDPAVGSAGVSGRQSSFAGSDRQGRGRLVRALQGGPVPLTSLAVAAGWPHDEPRAARAAASLVADGLAVEVDGRLALPG
jgi:A/G-specific adenine glycosylase